MAYFLGIDGGGTGCRALVCDEVGTFLGSGSAGSANIASDLKGARDNIILATQSAIEAAGLPADAIQNLSAYLGLAGANIDIAVAQLSELLPFADMRIVSDAAIALQGAIGSQDGAAAIIGTGSIFLQRKAGTFAPRGGWGFTVGDHASGARLGRSRLEASLLAHDGIRPQSPLTRTTMANFKNDPQKLVTFAQSASPADFGTFARDIFDFAERGDATAAVIISEAVQMIEDILQAMDLQAGEPFCMLGGLGPKYVPYLSATNRERVQPPLADAVSGAAALAVQHFSNVPNTHTA
ncbi:BadF/BadG/BcrA/BcrD ATPase family protein [Pararhizobium sp. IMCC21322]|uniref:BadF/BadG/BcrA/BcrD ATPase family protein n=1 Tax=Pararhizobium sp. IMCC21322 TaxID=3067903 RepID=UPI00274125B2|nr:BadF/BadG/BcrA/BcrD ATPase family protein [Pararhizobium sp. IMCC21322]